MYNLVRTTHLATGVEHSVYCNFYHTAEKSLVIAGCNVLRIFRLIPDVPTKTPGAQRREDKEDILPPKVKLECISSFTLHDNIATLGVVSLNPARDSLLLGFKDAKLSVVEYDPQTHNLKTISLHYFEKDDIKDGFYYNVHMPLVRVDPETRCACMLIYGRKVVVLPFRKELASEDINYDSPLARGPIMQSYIVEPREFESLKIDNVIDMQFLHGYYDPTLVLLYEPIKTFPGRVAVRQDTCCFAAISLNIRQRLHPVIWSIQNLPYDCFKLLPVPKPIGGALLFACNSLTYLTQSVPPYGISLNSLGDKNTNFPLRKQEGVIMSLETATAEFLAEDRVVISLKTGELFVLTLVADSMRSVRSFHLDKAASSVLTCCMSVCEGQYLFLGSRLGNSLLLRFTEKELNDPTRSKSSFPVDQEPPSKRKKLDTFGDWVASNVDDIEDPDILKVYGPEETRAIQPLASYTFEVMDSLLNIGPCSYVAMGEPAFLSEEYETNTDPCVELVCTSGHGKNGALSVLQRSIKPQVLTTFDLPGIIDMWTLVGKTEERKKKDHAMKEHSFLILSRADSALILRTEEEISELEESGFNTASKTVFAGNIGNNRFIVQVTGGGVRLLDGTVQIQQVVIDIGSPIVSASLADPYLVCLTDCGTVMIFTLITSRFAVPKLTTKKISPNKKAKLQTICAYCDMSGLFTTDFPDDGSIKRKIIKTDAEIKKELDDEDEMLYASTTTSVFDPPKVFDPKESSVKKVNKWWQKWYREQRPSYWVVATTDMGDFEIYTLPDFIISYTVRNFWIGNKVMMDHSQSAPNEHTRYAQESIPTIHEILVTGMGYKNLRPVLFARIDEDILIYEAFTFSENLEPSQLKIRFRMLEHHMILREKGMRSRQNEESRKKIDRICKLKPFNNISVYNGVFICGPYPHWVILTVRGEFRFHPMSVDGAVKCFAPFRNINCLNGFLYFNRKDSLRICLLPTILSYDAPWPVRKVPLRCTPHFVVHHLETKTYCVITANSEETNRIWKFNGDDKEEVDEERDERFIKFRVPLFTAQLFSPVNWQVIPNTDFDFEKWEHVTCCKNVLLSYEGDRSGLRGYIAIGSTFSYGEDITCRGRIIIFDVIDVVPEPGQPLTKNRLKVLYDGEQKGPVTAIAYCCGNLVSAIGQKIYIWQLKDNELVGVAFIDIPVYVHRILAVKNIIYVADVVKSVFLLRFQEENRTLSLVSKDQKPMHVYSTEFIVDNSSVAFVASDAEKNLVVFTYNPEARESMGGTRLVRKGDFNLGHHVNFLLRIRCRVGDVSGDHKNIGNEKKHMTLFASLDGSIGYLLAISERTYRRFSMIYNLLVQSLPHIAEATVSDIWSVLGGKAVLPCPVEPSVQGDRTVLILWFKEGKPESIYSYDARRDDFSSGVRWADDAIFQGRAHYALTTHPPTLAIQPSKESDQGIFTCRVEYLRSPPTFVKVNLSIIIPPDSPVIYWDGEEVMGSTIGPMSEGEIVELICYCKGGRPTPSVTWWQQGRQLESITEAKVVSGQTVVLSKTTVKSSRSIYGVSFVCQAKAPDAGFSLTPPKAVAVTLNMTLPPISVKISGVPVTISAGTTIHPVCEAAGSHPPAEIVWTKDNKRLSRVTKSVMEGGNITKASVTIHTSRQDHEKSIQCQAFNPALTNQNGDYGILSDALTLNIHFEPIVRIVLGRMLNASSLLEGKDAFFECIVQANPPPHKIEWFHDGKAVVQKNGIVISGANLGLQKLQRNHSGIYQCAATNLQGKDLSEATEINIKFAPVCSSRENRLQGAAIGQNSKIFCRVEADPVDDVRFDWSKVLPSGREMRIPDDNVTVEERPQFVMSDGTTGGTIMSYITVTPEHIGEFGKFICRARNSIGPQKEPCVVALVSAGPPEPPFNCSVTPGVEGLTAICREGFNGGFPQEFQLEAWVGEEIFSNSTSDFPSWTIEGLSEGLEVLVKIRAKNPKGTSRVVTLVAHMPIAHQQSVTEPEASVNIMGPIIGAVLGVAAVLALLLAVVFLSACRRRRIRRGKSSDDVTINPHQRNSRGPDVVTSVRHRQSSSPAVDVLGNASVIVEAASSTEDVAPQDDSSLQVESPERSDSDNPYAPFSKAGLPSFSSKKFFLKGNTKNPSSLTVDPLSHSPKIFRQRTTAGARNAPTPDPSGSSIKNPRQSSSKSAENEEDKVHSTTQKEYDIFQIRNDDRSATSAAAAASRNENEKRFSSKDLRSDERRGPSIRERGLRNDFLKATVVDYNPYQNGGRRNSAVMTNPSSDNSELSSSPTQQDGAEEDKLLLETSQKSTGVLTAAQDPNSRKRSQNTLPKSGNGSKNNNRGSKIYRFASDDSDGSNLNEPFKIEERHKLIKQITKKSDHRESSV